jgi:hypothetical protein
VPKISELFSPKSSGVNETGSSVDVVSDFQPQQNNEGASGESTISTAAMSTTMTDSVPQPHNISTESLPSDDPASFSTDASEYSCDLGFWPASVLDRMREHWAAKGSSQCRNLDSAQPLPDLRETVAIGNAREACLRTPISLQSSKIVERGSGTRHLHMQCSALHVN